MRHCVINSLCSLLATVFPHAWISMKPFLIQNASEVAAGSLFMIFHFARSVQRTEVTSLFLQAFQFLSVCWYAYFSCEESFIRLPQYSQVSWSQTKLRLLVSATWKNFRMLNSMRHKHILGIPPREPESPNSTISQEQIRLIFNFMPMFWSWFKEKKCRITWIITRRENLNFNNIENLFSLLSSLRLSTELWSGKFVFCPPPFFFLS